MFSELMKSRWRHSGLFVELTKREFSGRYRGSFAGILWAFVQPLFLLSVYTVAFGIILKARWGLSETTADYALMLFAGLIIFNAFSEVLSKSTTLVVGNPNFVKKVVFPLELLPVVAVATALIHAAIGLGVWFVGYMLLIGIPKATALMVPLILIPFVPVLLGIAWLFSATGVIVKDTTQFVSLLNHALLFLTPIFYSVETAPLMLQKLLLLNPLTFIIDQLRLVLFYGQAPAFGGLALYCLIGVIFAWIAYRYFGRLRPSFADLV
jgi:lipopolysaccharide transport system permease protein